MSRPFRLGLLLWVLPLIVVGATSTARAQSQQPIKPYVVFIMDVSGSMNTNVASGFASCVGAGRTRIDHAKCAVQNVANNYGEMDMALARFRQSAGCSPNGVDCDPDGDGVGCTQDSNQATGCTLPGFEDGDRFEVLVPIVDDNQAQLVQWTNFTCGAGDPEINQSGYTPLAGSLVGAKRYWQGLASPTQGAYWPTSPGDDPIRDDPKKTVFTSVGNQCRPYITILMTDGDETCARTAAQANTAATALLTTNVDGLDYRVVTKVIGFGQTPLYQPLEDIAHAGGTPGDGNGGAPEAFYAQNEEDLELAINQIIADAIKFEKCNGLDDDCDIAVDEDFQLGACTDNGVGNCQGTGDYVCNAAQTGTDCVITNPGASPAPETCDGTDEDCDGLIDEGACTGCTGVELCNGMDDDCDVAVDENLTRPCGTDLGVCTSGVETCSNGQWINCSATGGSQEVCSPNGPGPGVDEDCDGTVDGISEPCISAGNPNIGPCHGGFHDCPTDGTGPGPCLGEVLPAATDPCNGIDDDCDGLMDENFVPADCSSTCGIGQTECDAQGNVVCNAMAATDDETCNGIDDDCDSLFDEDAPPGGACDGGGTICNGQLVCMGGTYVCVGQSIQPELCNCIDDNCNTVVDEGNICPTDTQCVHPSQSGFDCQCAGPCQGIEFPCPLGRVCVDNFCLIDPCFGVDCPAQGGDAYECQGGACVRSCDLAANQCPTGFVCFGPDGMCHPDDCTTFPDRCAADEQCVGGTCVSDPCSGVNCNVDEYCLGGDCFASCAGIDCPTGERCRLGACEADPCGAPCPTGMVCDDSTGECQGDQCHGTNNCPTGERCDPQTGQCQQDPCLGVICPGTGQVCLDGTCYNPEDITPTGPDAGPQDFVTAGGGGGCQTGAGGSGGALVALMLVLWRRRPARKGARS